MNSDALTFYALGSCVVMPLPLLTSTVSCGALRADIRNLGPICYLKLFVLEILASCEEVGRQAPVSSTGVSAILCAGGPLPPPPQQGDAIRLPDVFGGGRCNPPCKGYRPQGEPQCGQGRNV